MLDAGPRRINLAATSGRVVPYISIGSVRNNNNVNNNVNDNNNNNNNNNGMTDVAVNTLDINGGNDNNNGNILPHLTGGARIVIQLIIVYLYGICYPMID